MTSGSSSVLLVCPEFCAAIKDCCDFINQVQKNNLRIPHTNHILSNSCAEENDAGNGS